MLLDNPKNILAYHGKIIFIRTQLQNIYVRATEYIL